MTVTVEDLPGLLGVDFLRACAELAAAQLVRKHKDTAAHRAAVAERQQRVDAVLDLYLELRCGCAPAAG